MEATNERAKWEKLVDFLTKRNERLEKEGEEKDEIIAGLEATIQQLLNEFQAAQDSSPLETTCNIEQLELHDLLNGKQILVIGACACKQNHLLGYAKNWFAVQRKDFKFVTEYESIKNREIRVTTENTAAIIVGPMPHYGGRVSNDLMQFILDYQYSMPVIICRSKTSSEEVKITKESFGGALNKVFSCLRANRIKYGTIKLIS